MKNEPLQPLYNGSQIRENTLWSTNPDSQNTIWGVDLFLNQELQIWLKPQSISIDVTLSRTVKWQNVQMTKKGYYYYIYLNILYYELYPQNFDCWGLKENT